MPSREAHGRDCVELLAPFLPTQLFNVPKPDIKAKQSSAQRKYAETHTEEDIRRSKPFRTSDSKNSSHVNMERSPPSTKEKSCTTQKNPLDVRVSFFPHHRK
jgi:hypothetical protein